MDESAGRSRWIESLELAALEARLREVAHGLFPDRVMDDLEVRHLMRVISECALLLGDVYSDERIARVLHPDRGLFGNLLENSPTGFVSSGLAGGALGLQPLR